MKKRAIFISSTGGHLTQLLQLDSLMKKYDSLLVTERNTVTESLAGKYKMKFLKFSSRKKWNFIFLFIYNSIKSFWYIVSFRPKYIITTGAGTAFPMCVIGKILGRKIIYIESFARVNKKSSAGKLIYPFANLFIVQWPEMLKLYPKAKYIGKIY